VAFLLYSLLEIVTKRETTRFYFFLV